MLFKILKDEFGDLTEEEEKLVKQWADDAKSVHGKKTDEEIKEFIRDALRNHRLIKHESDR